MCCQADELELFSMKEKNWKQPLCVTISLISSFREGGCNMG